MASGYSRRNAKEYDADDKKAKQMYKAGKTVRQIAVKLGLTMTQVNIHVAILKAAADD